MSVFDGLFKIDNRQRFKYSVLCEGEEEGIEWLVQITLKTDELDDSFDSNYYERVTVVAPDFSTDVKYAEQYIRTMQLAPETKNTWKEATIVSIEKRI